MDSAAYPHQSVNRTNGSTERRPGGVRRFLLASIITVVVLVGTIWGMMVWMAATARTDYKGPPKLQYPEHRPFR